MLHTVAQRRNSEDDPGNNVVTAALSAGKGRRGTLVEAGRRPTNSRRRSLQRRASRAIAPAKHFSRAGCTLSTSPGCPREGRRTAASHAADRRSARDWPSAECGPLALSTGRSPSHASAAVTVAATARPPQELDATPT
ncbi:hypothetical protein MTO96_003165 [Rhipicephalus appendiculatus]